MAKLPCAGLKTFALPRGRRHASSVYGVSWMFMQLWFSSSCRSSPTTDNTAVEALRNLL